MDGVLIVNKPQGFTSFDIVAIVRKLTSQKKVGHSGTLDPMATGVLPVLIGNAAKAQSILPDSDKAYTVEFKLGVSTDTYDIWGNQLKAEKSEIKKSDILNVLSFFRGEQLQIPPMFSAVQINGKRLYDLARQGIEVERKPKKILISNLELVSFDEVKQSGKLKVSCSKGTYIRSLIYDIGQKLNTCAVMTSLERTTACGYDIEGAFDVTALKDNPDRSFTSSEIEKRLLPVESIFNAYSALQVTQAQFKRFKNGGALDLSRTGLKKYQNHQIIRIKNNKDFAGLGIVNTEKNSVDIYKIF